MRPRKRSGTPRSFREFWPFYLGEHSKPATRWIHFAGTTLGFTVAVWGIVTGKPWFLLLALLAGYAPAWFSHFLIEKNRPATFRFPFWSLLADLKMWLTLWKVLWHKL